jgi:type II secretory pathway pseudopilin PulG
MNNSSKSAGFTIVETLIVLGVTGALFIAIIGTMIGRQNRAEFLQATHNIQFKIQQSINDVSTGFYPNNGDFTCAASPSGPTFTASPRTQGSNEDCVFLGKVMQFNVGGVAGANETYNTYSIAGLRAPAALTLLASKPKVIQGMGFDTITRNALAYGLKTLSVKYNGFTQVGAVGFISGVGVSNGNGGYQSGAQQVDLIPVNLTLPSQTEAAAVLTIDSNLASSPVNPSGGVQICFQGGNNQTALITIGSNGHDLAVKLEVKTCT